MQDNKAIYVSIKKPMPQGNDTFIMDFDIALLRRQYTSEYEFIGGPILNFLEGYAIISFQVKHKPVVSK